MHNPINMVNNPYDWYHRTAPDERYDMMKFHEHPTQEVFNQILENMGELYKPVEDLTEGLYVTLEGESAQDAAIRRHNLKEHIANQTRKIIYQDPYKLSWIYACVQTCPWLIDGAELPLLIERAILYNMNSYHDMIITASTELGPFDDTLKGTKARRSYKQTRTHATVTVLGHAFLRYGASGNLSYIANAADIIRAYPIKWNRGGDFRPMFLKLCNDAETIRSML